MSDIYCKCGEPWEVDSLHEWVDEHHGPRERWLTNGKYDDEKYAKLFSLARKTFRAKGCEMFGCGHSGDLDSDVGKIQELADDLMGDDIDGVASMMEDARSMGLF